MQTGKDLKPGISLCMIVKNEQESITRALESVHGLVDEMIVIDTGSEDKTKEYAHHLGAQVFLYAWDDNFSNARNFAIEKAMYEWIFVIDADEIISQRDFSQIKTIVQEKNADAVVFQQRNYCESPDAEGWRSNNGEYEEGAGFAGYFDVPVIRLFKNTSAIRFKGVVHEVVDACLQGRKKRYLDVVIHHYTYFEKPETRVKKGEFYLSLLLKQFEADPYDLTTCFLLGRQYYTLGKDAEALVFLKQVIDMGTRCEIAYDNLASIYLRTGMYEEARDTLEALLRLNPRYTEAFANLGIAYYELGFTVKAIDTLKRAGVEQPHAFRPYFNLAAICYREKKYSDAIEYIQSAENVIPHFPRVYYLKFHILYELQMWNKARHAAEKLKMFDPELYGHISERYQEIEERILEQKGVSSQ